MTIHEAKIMSQINLTIIIVSFNSSEVIINCLKSFDINKYKVFVVDNKSSDNTLQIVKNFKKQNNLESLCIIENDKNIGFGRANNMVLKNCDTPFALIINPDAQIDDENISQCLNVLENNPQIAISSPEVFAQKPVALDKNISICYENFIVGGVMFVNMTNLQKIGFFAEEYFMFAEDSDLCYRSIKLGYKNAIIKGLFALHQGGNSSKKTLRNYYRRFWHLGWSKTNYKIKRKNKFNYYRSTLRLGFWYFLLAIIYLCLLNYNKSVKKLAFSLGCLARLIGLKAFDKNGNPRG